MEDWKSGNDIIFLIPLHYNLNSKNYFTELLLSYFQSSTLSVLQCEALCASHCSVGKDGFEPPNSGENRFTVCCRWPLDYLPDGNHCLRPTGYIPDVSPGAREGSRTRDLLITNQLLYQLSYSGLILLPHNLYKELKQTSLIVCFFWEGKGKRIC